MQEKAYLIDGNAYMYRAFYAIAGLTNSKGQPTGALHGFTSMILRFLKEKKPAYLAVVFDSKGPTFRHEKYKEYKIQRKPMPDDLISQMSIIKDILRILNITVYAIPGYEGDDILASLAKRFESHDKESFIVTSDKDMLQLVNDKIKILSIHKDNYIYDTAKVMEKYSISPKAIVDYLALAGDSADNIPGVKGVGEKTAISLLKEFGDLDGIYNSLDNISKARVKTLLETYKDDAYLSRELAVLDIESCKDEDIEKSRVKPFDKDEAVKLFKELEFFKLIGKLDVSEENADQKQSLVEIQKNNINYENQTKQKQQSQNRGNSSTVQRELFIYNNEQQEKMSAEGRGVSPLAVTPEVEENIKELEENIKKINISEYQSLISNQQNLEIFFLAGNDQGQIIFKIKNKDQVYCISDIEGFLNNENICFTGFDLKHFYKKYNINSGKNFDVLIAYYLLFSGKSNYLTADICMQYITEVWEENHISKNLFYLEKIKEIILADLKQKKIEDLFFNIEMPLIKILAEIENEGMKIDKEILKAQSKTLGQKLEDLTKKIYELAGESFNINSPKQLGSILFEKLKFPKGKKTKTGYSTSVSVLEKLAPDYEIVGLVLGYRKFAKLKNTYTDVLPSLADNKDRVHTTLVQTGTATGRLSSKDPNLQNIPIKSEDGKNIRKGFIVDKGKKLLSADYSQIELRILAHLSGDPVLTDAFVSGADIHTKTASEVFYIEEERVTPEMRRIAKAVNFGIIYGMSSFGLAKDLNIPVTEAQNFIDAYFLKFSKVRIYLDELIKKTEQNLYVRTIKNRYRAIPDILSSNKQFREFAKRTALNTPMQGSAADLIKIAMIEVYNFLQKQGLKSKIIMQVHDELLLEVPEEELDSVKSNIKNIMENCMPLKVPLKVDINIAESWGQIK